MVRTRDHFFKHSLGIDSIKIHKDEVLGGRSMIIPSGLSHMDQVSIYFDKEWGTFETLQERISYFDFESIDEVKRYHEHGCASRYEYDG